MKNKKQFIIYDKKLNRYRLNGGRFVSRSFVESFKGEVYLYKSDKLKITDNEYYYNKDKNKFFKGLNEVSHDELLKNYNKRNIKTVSKNKIYRSHTKLDSIRSKNIIKNSKKKQTDFKNVSVITNSIDITDYFKLREGIYIVPYNVKDQKQIIKNLINGVYKEKNLRLWIYWEITQKDLKNNTSSKFEVSTVQLTEEEKTMKDIDNWYEDVFDKLAKDAVNKASYNAKIIDFKAVIVFKRW